MPRGKSIKLWSIDDVDPSGNLGLTILLARDEQEAREKFAKMHGGFLAITEIETCLALSLAMSSADGATSYKRRT